jgi:lipoate-protein ligase A
MRVLPPEVLPPEENMRRDEGLLFSLEEGTGEPTFRLYEWDRLCLSIGYSQKPPRDAKVPVVRRPTGGGALVHGWDLSFALVDFRERWGGSPCGVYSRFAGFLADVFSKVGVQLKMERFRGRYLERYYCFFAPTFGELSFKGRKLVAMAMRTLKRAFLIHGSVYVDPDYGRLARILGLEEDELRRRIVSLRELGVRKGDLVEALISAFSLRSAVPG